MPMDAKEIERLIKARFPGAFALLDNKYYFDKFNEAVFGGGARLLGKAFWRGGDVAVIDGAAVDAGFAQAARNIPNVDVLPVQGINVYDILSYDQLVLTMPALAKITEVFGK